MPTRKFNSTEHFKTPEEIAEFLNFMLEDAANEPEVLMLTFRDVAESMGGVSEMARRAGLNREALSRALSGKRSPRIDTIMKIASAAGVRLQFSA